MKAGDFVIAPFAYFDNTCEFCREGRTTNCLHGGFFSTAQAEAVRVPQADGTLVKAPVGEDSALLPSLLTLSDVLITGHHAAVTAGVNARTSVTVIGDGAVGLLAVLAAKRLGAEQIILMGRHKDRTDLGREFGATDVVAERGEEGIAQVRELTGGHGTHAVLECVGHMPAYEQAVRRRPRGRRHQPGRRAAVRGGAGRLRHPLRPQHHPHRRARRAARLHRGAAARGPRRPHRAGQGLRPHRRPRRRARRLPRHGRPRGPQGPRPALIAPAAAVDPRRPAPRRRHGDPAEAPSTKGPAQLFTGDVRFDVIARGEAPSRVRVNTVRFAPCARTAWHSHSLGQTLHVTDGVGRVQSRGGEVLVIRPGDVIYTPPGEEHWHGAAPDSFMVHTAIWEDDDATWGDHVTDEEYDGR